MLAKQEAKTNHRAHSVVTLSSPRRLLLLRPLFLRRLPLHLLLRPALPERGRRQLPSDQRFLGRGILEVFWRYSAHCPMVRPVAQRRWNRQTSIPLPVWSRAGRRDAVKPAEHRKFPST